MANIKYQITVYTGEIEDGGTDANVQIKLFGEKGTLGGTLDTKDHDDFETGMNDTYTLSSSTDIGDIKQIYIKHDNSGKKPGWYLDGVTVSAQGKIWYFPANRWLAKDEGDGTIYAYIKPGKRQVHYEYIGNYPEDRENGWSEEVNGVCHDEGNWFFTQNGNLWRFPAKHNLKDTCKSANPAEGIFEVKTSLHMGDIDYYNKYVFVPISNNPVHIRAYRAKDLALVAKSYMIKPNGTKFDDCGWLAINPKSGYLYTSDGDVNSSSPILIYKIDMDAVKKGKDFLTYHSCITLYDIDGTLLKRGSMQGGCFDNENHLHISNGYWTREYKNNNGGISVFAVPQYPEKNSHELVTRMTHSNQNRDFRYEFSGVGDEPEGLTYWEVDSLGINTPGIHGELHAIMLNNTGTGDDDLYFKHFRRV